MIFLNYNNLDAETQEYLLGKSKKEVLIKYGKELKTYAVENHIEYETLLEEEAIKNLYNYTFVFNV